MSFVFGAASQHNLIGVHPLLARVAHHAITISAQDFCVEQGVRSKAQQLEVWKRHTSKLNGIPKGMVENGITGTGEGNHQVKDDGYGHAADLTPWVDGKILWAAGLSSDEQWHRIYLVAAAMQQAADEEGATIRWGGVWDRHLNDLGHGAAALADEVVQYEKRHAGPDFIDGPHYEVVL